LDPGAEVRLLVVEDEARIAAFLVKGLEGQGYSVDCVATGTEALARSRDPDLDLLILDLGLADIDGLDVLRQLRDEGHRLPVIILTARGEVEDRVEGLNLGADDYITKPFAFDELLARIRARLRSRNGDVPAIQVGDVRLEPLARRVDINGESVELTARELELLETFMRHPGQVLTREELLSQVWGMNFDPGTNIVDVYVGYLRRKLGEKRIETVRSMGYRLVIDDR
jgi:DNA-binding response OmpR family regulator